MSVTPRPSSLPGDGDQNLSMPVSHLCHVTWVSALGRGVGAGKRTILRYVGPTGSEPSSGPEKGINSKTRGKGSDFTKSNSDVN